MPVTNPDAEVRFPIVENTFGTPLASVAHHPEQAVGLFASHLKELTPPKAIAERNGDYEVEECVKDDEHARAGAGRGTERRPLYKPCSPQSTNSTLRRQRHPQPVNERKSMATTPTPSNTSQSAALPRGAACLPCRRRKMRCNAARPFCIQCYNKGKPDDCEYPGDIQGLTRTQMLEENIMLLEARIRDLEEPGENSIQLLPAPTQRPSQSSVDFSPPVRENPARTEPTAQEVKALIDAFIPHAGPLGFFLNIPRFLHLAQNINPTSPMTHPLGPIYDPLLCTVCLWGARLSSDNSLRRYEDMGLVCRSVRLLASSVPNLSHASEPNGNAIVAVIQAEVLLANYLCSVGRTLEGRYHSGAAAALCVSSRLHVPAETLTTANRMAMAPSAPMDHPDNITLGERVNAFWTVYSLDTLWAIASESLSSMSGPSAGTLMTIPPNMTISAPWPRAMADYEHGHQVTFDVNYRPIENLLNGTDRGDTNRLSPPALRAQATTLVSRAACLISRYNRAMSISETSNFWHEFNVLNDLATRFVNNLPPVGDIGPGDCDNHDILVATTLTHASIIQLHHKFSGSQNRSRDLYVQSAQAVSSIMHRIGSTVRCLDPIMALLLTVVCQVFVNEIKGRTSSGLVGGNAYPEDLKASLDKVLNVMAELGRRCPLMNSQASQIRESMNP